VREDGQDFIYIRLTLQQLALALARLFEGPPGQRDTTFHNADQLALTSLISFAIGALSAVSVTKWDLRHAHGLCSAHSSKRYSPCLLR
jgi:hypothetical protein